MNKRYLTKSRFKTAFVCPTKLFYLDRKMEYANKMADNDFLRALAQGGYQVGALAKVYYGPGVDLEGIGTELAIEKTRELLKQENVTIFEAALQAGDFLVRVDILKKTGQSIELLEVKSKSHDFADSDFFKRNKKTNAIEKVQTDWLDYVIDVAFQTYVAELALPSFKIHPSLVLADKRRVASRDGIHQHFLIQNRKGQPSVAVREGVTAIDLATPLLSSANVRAEVNFLIQQERYLKYSFGKEGISFQALVELLARHLVSDIKFAGKPGADCKSCEFRTPAKSKEAGLKSGFEECWSEFKKLKPADFKRPLVFELWDGRSTERWLAQNKIFLTDLSVEDLSDKEQDSDVSGEGLTRVQRQIQQIKLVGTKVPYFDKEGFSAKLAKFKYPFHFIDFETTMVAIPFHQGRKPYEQLAFQFSHHVLKADGLIAHHNQFISIEPGKFPNFEFVRQLRASLAGDSGTIFRFSNHENTVLRQIMRQLQAEKPDDHQELCEFILSITQPTKEEQKSGARPGPRNMIDLCDLVKKFYLHPDMGGSNSIKVVMPAILNDSEFLKQKYSQAIYGKSGSIKSLNQEGSVSWVKFGADQRAQDPYKLLPAIMTDVDQGTFNENQLLFQDESLKDGGAAMTAWARMQFTEMSATEREAIKMALLRYCELDTLAMVWIMEEFKAKAG